MGPPYSNVSGGRIGQRLERNPGQPAPKSGIYRLARAEGKTTERVVSTQIIPCRRHNT